MTLKPKDQPRARKPKSRLILDTRTPSGRAKRDALLLKKAKEQSWQCALCGGYMTSESVTWDHIIPRGMGGGTRDDGEHNIQAVHGRCNSLKGSRRLPKGAFKP